MLDKLPITDQTIIDSLNDAYDIKVVKLTFLPIGADLNSSVYKVEDAKHSAYFVKIKRGAYHDIGNLILAFLQNAGIQTVIPPVITVDGHTTYRVEDFTFIVYPYIVGQDGFTQALTEGQWRILGKTLRKIHDRIVPPSIQGQVRREEYSPKWREVVRSFYSYVDASPFGDESARTLLTFMKQKLPLIQQLVDRAEALAQQLQTESHPYVLCHSDIHAGNILLDENHTIYLVDWDDPIMAPKERDLMFIGGGVGNVWNDSQEVEYFYQGYGNVEVNKTILAYYRHERIVEDIAVYCQDLLLTTAGDQNRPEMLKHFIAMFESEGVVEIALRSQCLQRD